MKSTKITAIFAQCFVTCTFALWYPQRQGIGLPKTSMVDAALCFGQLSIDASSLAHWVPCRGRCPRAKVNSPLAYKWRRSLHFSGVIALCMPSDQDVCNRCLYDPVTFVCLYKRCNRCLYDGFYCVMDIICVCVCVCVRVRETAYGRHIRRGRWTEDICTLYIMFCFFFHSWCAIIIVREFVSISRVWCLIYKFVTQFGQ